MGFSFDDADQEDIPLLFFTFDTAQKSARRFAFYILCNGVIEQVIEGLLIEVLQWLELNVVLMCLWNTVIGIVIIR